VTRAALLVVLALLLGGCAWSNRANRPVWNAFEAHLVPDSSGAFYATLPLTVPAGLLSILLDTFIVHPAQVADDAWDDAAELWDDIPWAEHYYTQLATLPFRAAATPLVFVGMFLGRSAFDLPSHGAQAEAAATRERLEEERTSTLLAVLQAAAGGNELAAFDDLVPPRTWTPELQAAFDAALHAGDAAMRLRLITYARDRHLPPWSTDPTLGLRDPDAVVRYELLSTLPVGVDVPADLIDALRDDPDSVVRWEARHRWP